MLFILECIGVVQFGLLWPDFVLLFFAFPFAKVRNRKFRLLAILPSRFSEVIAPIIARLYHRMIQMDCTFVEENEKRLKYL